ncbi:MAG: IS5 family transposase [Caldilineae bacterium]|nr:MAG: IS5 family transposase [Caldilineae bacterium]
MRGKQTKQSSMLCLMSPESVVPADHPLRRVKKIADEVLEELSPQFDAMYSKVGRPSVPPERLLKSLLLIALYSIRSERMFCEQLGYNLLFRWFLDMDMMGDGFDASTFSRNRERLLEHDVAGAFFRAVRDRAKRKRLMSSEHFSVDGTLIESWASLKSFRPKDEDDDHDGNGWGDFRGTKRSNETHASKTDPDARLVRKGKGREAKLCFGGHVLMENRNGLVVDILVNRATGFSEREAAIEMLERSVPGARRVTLGADRGYDTRDFIEALRERNVTPHVAPHDRRNNLDGRTTRHRGYAASLYKRMQIEKIFGWAKTIGGLRKSRFRGIPRNQMAAYITGAAYNLLRLAKLEASYG